MRILPEGSLPPRDPGVRSKGNKLGGMNLPQVRVLHALVRAGHPMTRSQISRACGNKTDVVVHRAVGYSDPDKRKAFEKTKDGGFRKSLLSLGYVEETEIDHDGVVVLAISLTEAGKNAFESLGKVKLPPLKD